MPPRIRLTPPLLNSATPWATTHSELSALYACAHTGAVTTRTTLLHGFEHDARVHQHTFLPEGSSLNTYGYSPYALEYYLRGVRQIVSGAAQKKPFIISITGTPTEVSESVSRISAFAAEEEEGRDVWIELNLSCPNIPSKPPPAYDHAELCSYLQRLPPTATLPIGLKTPPYTYAAQFTALVSAIRKHAAEKIAFVTATNTLGSSLHLSDATAPTPTLPGSGIGGLAGAAIHCLSLGNVNTLRRELDNAGLRDVTVIGVGGVSDAAGMRRMLAAGAVAVGVGTAFGREGVGIFASVLGGVSE
ncbi:hypothetical protein FN846DRAFT_787292 [Sphaerosporella brunnea]|uniref:Dihydroorotate oxidase n=1 Tax=Sphaerosporella brunnea TaxID=1250544 RepID=A0A5J5EFW0_9PEZI|nr:hypothetical protein FN846DRAFT_787292 [Sphaerosporella brunnea]